MKMDEQSAERLTQRLVEMRQTSGPGSDLYSASSKLYRWLQNPVAVLLLQGGIDVTRASWKGLLFEIATSEGFNELFQVNGNRVELLESVTRRELEVVSHAIRRTSGIPRVSGHPII